MSLKPEYLNWLKNSGQVLQTADGKSVEIFELDYSDNAKIFSEWAKHLRNHYCYDHEIDSLRQGTGLSRCDYLINFKFPDTHNPPGPSVRAGDFGEIIVADFVEFFLKYKVPRTRYIDKKNRNRSPEGVDVIGFRQIGSTPSIKDELITFEVKCSLTGVSSSTLQRALNDSCKDFILRKSESLNAIKQRIMLYKKDAHFKVLVERFQDKIDLPYKENSGAAAIHSLDTYSEDIVTNTNVSSHPNKDNLFLLLIRGKELMNLVHKLYNKAADEA